MSIALSRRSWLQIGAAIPLAALGDRASAAIPARSLLSTGWPDVDRALGGGLRTGTLTVVIGRSGGGKSRFMQRLAQTSGISDSYTMRSGTSDMISLACRPDGQYVGCLLLDGPEPATDKEREAMHHDPSARDAFLARWFERTREVLRESGGIFVISVREAQRADASWTKIPDTIVLADGGYRVLSTRTRP